MASIPRYKPEQRLGAQGPYNVADPEAARQRGEGLTKIGGGLMTAAAETAEYNYKKQVADEANVEKTFDTEAGLLGQREATSIISNEDGNTALDGSNMDELYEERFQGLYAQANAIPNGKQRRLALDAINKQKRMQGQRLFNAKVVAHAGYIYGQAEKNTFGAAAIVGNDPGQYEDQMAQLEKTYQSMGLNPGDYKKAQDLAEESLSMAVIQHYTDKDDYVGAENAIKTQLTGKINPTKRAALLNQIDADRRENLTEKHMAKQRAIDEKNLAMKEREESLSADAYAGLMSQDPAEQVRARTTMREAFQQKKIRKEVYMAFMSVEDKFLERESDSEVVMYSKRLSEGRDMQNFTGDVMNNSALTNKDKSTLLNQFRRAGGATKPNRIYQQKFSKAQKFINDAFPKRTFEEPEVRAGRMASAQRVFLEAINKGESDVFKAATDAVREIDPTNLALPQMTAAPSAKELNEEIARIKKRFNEIQKTNADQAEVDRLTKRMREINSLKARINAEGTLKEQGK